MSVCVLQVLREAIPLLRQEGGSANEDVLTSIYNSLCTMIAKNVSRLQEATQFCQEAVSMNAESANMHNSLGVVLMHSGKNSNAIKSFKRAAALNKTSTMAVFNLALAYINTGASDLAMQSLQRVLTIDSNHVSARLQLQELRNRKVTL